VRASVEAGRIAPARYDSYLTLLAELRDAKRDWE
jgi:putative ribosome biogenesis GTPase RsgA